MGLPHRERFLVVGFLIGAATFVGLPGLTGPTSPGADPPPGHAVYARDPEHLWNRLHEALFVRTGPDQRTYGHDRLEPLLWHDTRHLLEPRFHDRAVRLLDEFLDEKGERLIEDPLKRAVLQRDLWLVFNWVEGDQGNFENPPRSERAEGEARDRLARRLAKVIGRLALTPKEIERLPDNYAAAIASKAFPTHYDPERPERAYLPVDLFQTDGPWVCLGRPDSPIAPLHLREGNPFTNSAFLVFLRLPDGRNATLAYLKRLRDFSQPTMLPADEAAKRRGLRFVPNPRLPQMPVGTEVALVRRALLIASPTEIMPSPLTESVQLRIYREVPDLTVQALDDALGGGTAGNRRARSWQAFHEFRLSRRSLFANDAGGLHAVRSDERDFKTGLGAHPWDEFVVPGAPDRPFPETRQVVIKETCFACHSLPGVASFNSFFNFRTASGKDDPSPASLSEMAPADVLRSTARWKQKRGDATALRRLLER